MYKYVYNFVYMLTIHITITTFNLQRFTLADRTFDNPVQSHAVIHWLAESAFAYFGGGEVVPVDQRTCALPAYTPKQVCLTFVRSLVIEYYTALFLSVNIHFFEGIRIFYYYIYVTNYKIHI